MSDEKQQSDAEDQQVAVDYGPGYRAVSKYQEECPTPVASGSISNNGVAQKLINACFSVQLELVACKAEVVKHQQVTEDLMKLKIELENKYAVRREALDNYVLSSAERAHREWNERRP